MNQSREASALIFSSFHEKPAEGAQLHSTGKFPLGSDPLGNEAEQPMPGGAEGGRPWDETEPPEGAAAWLAVIQAPCRGP